MLVRNLFFVFCFLLLSTLSFPAKAQQADTVKQNLFEKPEIEASVDAKAWVKHLQENLPAYLEEAVRKGMRKGKYIVNVHFLVEKDGSISDVKALNDPGFGLALGAVRTVRTGPKWQAGEVNGQKVRSYHTQPITFAIAEK